MSLFAEFDTLVPKSFGNLVQATFSRNFLRRFFKNFSLQSGTGTHIATSGGHFRLSEVSILRKKIRFNLSIPWLTSSDLLSFVLSVSLCLKLISFSLIDIYMSFYKWKLSC